MRTVNYVWRGRLANLEFLSRYDVVRKNRPKMDIVKLSGIGTLLVFPSLKYRLMGGQCRDAQKQMEAIDIPIISCSLQNITVVGHFGSSINIKKLSAILKSKATQHVYEPEIFASVLVRFKDVKVNIFGTGVLVFLGAKHVIECYSALYKLRNI